jgi:hypothetical protein
MIHGEAEKRMNTKTIVFQNHCGGEHTTCFVMSAPQHLPTLECTSPQYTSTSKAFYKNCNNYVATQWSLCHLSKYATIILSDEIKAVI